MLPELFTRDEEELFANLRTPAAVETLARATGAAGEDVAQVLDAAALAVALRRERAANLAMLQERLRPGLGVVLVPELFARSHGKRADAGRRGARRGAQLMTTTTLEQLLSAKEVVVTCGAGGVGKTTTAAALATMAALHLGGRVLVRRSIRPAGSPTRSASRASGTRSAVSAACLRRRRIEATRELWAAMLDTKASWDDLVRQHAPDARTRDAILANPLYENITARFVQSHDYIAMERLHELHASGRYDLIVVDTPPTRNALDFLDAPDRMEEFFGGRLLAGSRHRCATAPSAQRRDRS